MVKREGIIFMLLFYMAVLLCACKNSEERLNLESISKNTTYETIVSNFGMEDRAYSSDYYDKITYGEITIDGILATNVKFYFSPDDGSLLRLSFSCKNKGISKDGIDKLIESITDEDGKPTIKDKSISSKYYTCYYWNIKQLNLKLLQ